MKVVIDNIPETPEYSLKGIIAFIKHLGGKITQYTLDNDKYTLIAQLPDDADIPPSWRKAP
jgi:hypothetical protein